MRQAGVREGEVCCDAGSGLVGEVGLGFDCYSDAGWGMGRAYERVAIFGVGGIGAGGFSMRDGRRRMVRRAMARGLRLGLLGLVAAALLVYVVDTVVLQIRIRRGTAYRVVQVNQFLRTPLKGQKEEYDLMDTVPTTCARSIFPQPFPQPGAPACWWLERHTMQWQ